MVELLRSSYVRADFDTELNFRSVSTRDIAGNAIGNGASVLLYHAAPSSASRQAGDAKEKTLPVELRFLLTAWGREPTLQHAIAGWMMRVL
ncbi:MAG TPA: hypothetical protein VEL28_02580, partial [Candidatus Binatia bacterium]|nr:hypothetical protein [Candidatus Binatia bacterium]